VIERQAPPAAGRVEGRSITMSATIAATKLPETARTTLAGLSDEPWLCITETCVTDDGRVVLHATDFHRGDIFAFHVVRQRSEGPPVPNRL